MSKNASSGSDVRRKPGNPQETFEVEKYYYAGLFAAEMTCSVIKAANYNPVGHYYYAVDITVTNADKALLQKVNEVVMRGGGIISPVKGAFNLSARGKNRVRVALDFLDRYPIIIGDLAKNRADRCHRAPRGERARSPGGDRGTARYTEPPARRLSD